MRRILGAVLLAVVGLAPAVVSASDTGEREAVEPVKALEGEAAVYATAEILASSEGQSVEWALDALEHQEAMDLLQEKIWSLNPAAYGGAVHAEFPEIATVIYVKNDALEAARALAAESIGVKVERTDTSLGEFESKANSLADELSRLGFKTFSTGADLRRQQLTVEVEASALQARQFSVSELGDMLRSSIPVDVSVVDGPVAVLDHSYGGGQLRDGSVNECTSGFVVERNSDGVDGIVTAEHCHGLDTYREVSGNTYSMSYKGRALSSLGDVEWHTTTHIEYDDFYILPSTRVDVSGMKHHLYMDVGDSVCRYGRASGNGGCAQINQLFVTKNSGSNSYSSLIRTNPTPTSATGGDSGGPWYVGGTAWGVHSGRFSSNNDHAFSTLSATLGNMGVSLRTS